MVIRPGTTPDSERTQRLIADLAEEIDRQLANSADPQPSANIAPHQPLSGGVAEGLRSRYLSAGWGEVSFRETHPAVGAVEYKITFRR